MTSVPHWQALRSLGGNQLIRSAYIWFFVTPLAARIVQKVENPIQLSLGGRVIELDLVLPFSWQLLFWAALTFTIANLVYLWRCPMLIKGYRDFADYEQSKYYANRKLQQYQKSFKDVAIDWQKEFRVSLPDTRTEYDSDLKLDGAELEAVHYYNAVEQLRIRDVGWRAIATIMYGIGFAFLLAILCQNIAYVWSETKASLF